MTCGDLPMASAYFPCLTGPRAYTIKCRELHADKLMSTTISARAASQRFAEMLGKAAAGQTVIITRRGKPVATLAPYRSEAAASHERKAAWDRLLATLGRGVAIGISDAEARAWKFNRDKLYERAG
jgi:prevent-host-death family protein